MSVQTILLDFSIDPERLGDEVSRKEVRKRIEEALESYLPGLRFSYDMITEDGYFCVYMDKTGVVVSVRFFVSQGLITVNVEYFKANTEQPRVSLESIKSLENSLRNYLGSERSKHLPPIKRGTYIDVYLTSSDERLIEYDIDKMVFEKRSPFQKVQIVHSKVLGNMLVLDELQNLAEADLIYTETLMMRGVEQYEGKEICILGGGDGALLYELLKEKPKFVTMLEIDDVVMQACNEHLKSICGDVLERRRGPNFDIIVGDCMVALQKYIKEGRKFDYVFGDLTDVPISPTPTGELWDFIRTFLEASFKVLKPSGKFMTHANGSNCPEALRMYENELNKLDPTVKYTTSKAFVPSFMEEWNFYQVSFA
ncbi:spermine synthase isoform X1 [Phlebotomus argentipes]|uniref:spermine synthase isoform X1 n=1 Tax=Phlebotomus argentipes TaxID=94469 RepID=UPI002892DF79|nr:spermine synthase isoform X1 [Phlebotomus argentipes]